MANGTELDVNIDEHTYIIYDKSTANYHSFNNIYTINATTDYIQTKNLPFLSGKKALEEYNKNVEDQYKIHEKLDFEIYNFRFYKFVDIAISQITDELLIGIIIIDNIKLEKYFEKHNKVPNELFIKDALRFHKQYELEYERYISFTNSTPGTCAKITPSTKSTEKSLTPIQMVINNALEPKNKILFNSDKQPSCLVKKFPLKPHQQKNLKWWTSVEKHPTKIYYDEGMSFKMKIGNIFFDFRLDKFSNMKIHPYIKFKGGMLIDVVGTGKTLSSIISCVKNPIKKLKYISKGRINSGATLIITPSQVSKQWVREIQRFINPKKLELNIYTILGKLDLEKRTYQELLDADFVITSQSFWNNNHFIKLLLPPTFKKSYMSTDEYDFKTIEKILDDKRKIICEKSAKLEEASPLLPLIDWYRIIVDEIHEPYTDPKLQFMKNIMEHLNGTYKWGLSGTPFDKGHCVNDLVQFVVGKKISDEIYSNKEIYNYMTTKFFSRHINENGGGLKKLTEKIIWLNFSKTESMIYSAFIANPTVDKYGIAVRQLCCHPQLVEQLKGGVFDTCKTISDMENVMVKHYKNQYETAKDKINSKKEQIMRYEYHLLGLTYRQQKRFLRKLGYDVTIEYPDWYKKYKPVVEPDNENENKDLSDDSGSESGSDSDSDEREHITISADNQNDVKTKVKNLWKERVASIDTTQELINIAKNEIKLLETDMNGKKVSYKFFKNMLDKIKTAQEEKLDVDDSDYDSELEEEDGEVCSICQTIIDPNRIGMSICGHTFHYECMVKVLSASGKCPICSKKVNKNELFLVSHEKQELNSNGVMIGKSGLVNMVGTKLGNMICYLMSITDSVIIFSQWDDLLHKVGDILNQFGIPNRFCRGNVHMRDKAIRDFMDSKDIRAIMLSSKSSASGANMTKATKIIFLDPVFGTPEYITNTEWQAIGRAYRMGQENDVEIIRFITKNTVEEDIYRKNIENRKTSVSIDIDEVVDDTINISKEKLEIINNYVSMYQAK